MIALKIDDNSKIFEVDGVLFDKVKDFLTKLSKKEKKSFSYIDDIGDTIVVSNGCEYVVPTRDDMDTLYNLKQNDFISEEEAKKILDV